MTVDKSGDRHMVIFAQGIVSQERRVHSLPAIGNAALTT